MSVKCQTLSPVPPAAQTRTARQRPLPPRFGLATAQLPIVTYRPRSLQCSRRKPLNGMEFARRTPPGKKTVVRAQPQVVARFVCGRRAYRNFSTATTCARGHTTRQPRTPVSRMVPYGRRAVQGTTAPVQRSEFTGSFTPLRCL